VELSARRCAAIQAICAFHSGVLRDRASGAKLESRRSHAQQMEAVGRLAGGVRAISTTWLTVHRGLRRIAARGSPADSPPAKYVGRVVYAGNARRRLPTPCWAFSRSSGAQPARVGLDLTLANIGAHAPTPAWPEYRIAACYRARVGRTSDPAQIGQ